MSSDSHALTTPWFATTPKLGETDSVVCPPAAVRAAAEPFIHWLPLTLVCALHAAGFVWLAHSMSQPKSNPVPPALIGALVSPPEVTEPVPLPIQTKPLPKPTPIPPPRPQPIKPPPVAAPSERAVSAPPPQPPAPERTTAPVAEAPTAQVVAAPAPAPSAPPAPLIPPSTDASHLNTPASYPPMSKRLGEQGTVQLSVYVLQDGSVGEVKLKRSSGHQRLDQAALDAVRLWRYQPARRGSEAVATWFIQPVTFSLDG